MIRLLFFAGMFKGATSKVVWTGSTSAVRPLAPRQPGREELNALAAGSVSFSALSDFLSPRPVWAIRRTRLPNEVMTALGLLCCVGEGDAEVMPSPCA